jgi:hypothetical protein
VGSIPANSDAQNVPSFRRWRFEMKLSPYTADYTADYTAVYTAIDTTVYTADFTAFYTAVYTTGQVATISFRVSLERSYAMKVRNGRNGRNGRNRL